MINVTVIVGVVIQNNHRCHLLVHYFDRHPYIFTDIGVVEFIAVEAVETVAVKAVVIIIIIIIERIRLL